MLSRRWIINYVLIVLIVLFTYVGNRFDVQTGRDKSERVTTLRAADVNRIEIQIADESLALARTGSGWTLEAPVNWPANAINVERLLDVANASTESRLPADEIDAADIGLDFPRAILRLDDTSVLFGATNNIGQRRYVMIDSTVYLLPDAHLPFIAQGLVGLVDRRLLPRSLALDALKLPMAEIARGDDGRWQGEGVADATALESLVDNWQGLEASRVQRYTASATPKHKVEARLADGRRHEFFVMSIEPEIVIANPAIGLQYHFPGDAYYRLLAPRTDENTG